MDLSYRIVCLKIQKAENIYFIMNREFSTKELIDLLVSKLRVDYGSVEIKIHNGKCTNFTVSRRINYTEIEAEDLMEKVRK